jgi:hypothetical protein
MLKRLHESSIFSMVRTRSLVNLVRRPVKSEDKEAQSRMLQGEIEYGIVSPDSARQRLGCPDEAGKDAKPNPTVPAR